MRTGTLVLVVFLALSAAFVSQQAPTAGIEGVILRADTGEPVSGAQVSVTSVNIPAALLNGIPAAAAGGTLTPITVNAGTVAPGGARGTVVGETRTQPGAAPQTPVPVQVAPPRTFPAVTTSSDGRFSFQELPPGQYRITAQASGYVRQDFAAGPNTPGRPITLNGGQVFKDASIRMTPAGTLSGRIFDESGQPATGATVQLIRPVYNPNGRNYQIMGSGNVDDRGDYRLYGLPPGRYYIYGGTPPGPIRPVGLGGPAVTTSRYDPLFYPNVPDIERAVPVEIKSGGEMRVDMTVHRQTATYQIRGRVLDATGAAAQGNINVTLGYRTINGSGSSGQGRAYNPATGSFELQNVPPGNYFVRAQIQGQVTPLAGPVDTAMLDARRLEQASWPADSVPVTVIDRDIEGLVLTLRSAVTIPGRILVEGPASADGLGGIRINVGPVVPAVNTGAAIVSAPGPDGSFQIAGMRKGEYRVNVPLVPQGLYVKSVSYGGADILSKPFEFSGNASGGVEVVLRAGAGQISGIVTDARSQPVSTVQVFLMPASWDRLDTYKTGITDPNGRFTMTGISPGDYRIFSWESLENGAVFDPDFRRQYEQAGQQIRVNESSSQEVNVRLIPSP